MDAHLKPHYVELHRALGYLVHEWAWLESQVTRLMFDLAALHSKQFYDDDGVGNFFTTVSANIDLRSSVAIVKALAFGIGEERTVFNQLEPLLNEIAVDLRNKRNRFVHDQWAVLAHDHIVRFEKGTKLPKEPGTGERRLNLGSQEQFASVAEIEAVAVRVHNTRIELMNLGEELQEAYRRKYPAEE